MMRTSNKTCNDQNMNPRGESSESGGGNEGTGRIAVENRLMEVGDAPCCPKCFESSLILSNSGAFSEETEKNKEIEVNFDLGGSEVNGKNSGRVGVGKEKNTEAVEESPPKDDFCPICFDTFTLPCKTNCGHWYCASCILQFWNYRALPRRCKCPICCRLISRLSPQASFPNSQENEVVQALSNICQYNHLYVEGLQGGLMRVRILLPLFIQQIFWEVLEPFNFRSNYKLMLMRGFALLLAGFYRLCSFRFIPTRMVGAYKWFDVCVIAMEILLLFVGILRTISQRHRIRPPVGIQA